MADVTIGGIATSVTTLAAADLFEVEQSATTKKMTATVLQTFMSAKGTAVASASITVLGAGEYFHITGVVTITDIDFTDTWDGRRATVMFDGILTLTHNITTLVLPGGVSIVTAAGDLMQIVVDSGDNVVVTNYQRAITTPPSGNKGVAVASAGTTVLGAGEYFHITGTTTITDIDFAEAVDGRRAILVFDGILTLTHSGTTLILPGGASITTAAGDCATIVQDAGDNIRVVNYERAQAVVLAAGSATALSKPRILSGTILTAAEAGAIEYDGATHYLTNDTSSGRGAVPNEQYFHLSAAGGTISTIANFFGTTSNPTLVANAYYVIDIYCFYLCTTAGTVTWTFTNSAAPTSQNIVYEMSPLGGILAPAGSAGADLFGQVYNDATAAKALTTTGTLTTAVNHYARFKIFLRNGTGTSLKIQATKLVGGTITPGINSYWFCKRISPNNIGTFSA